MRLIVLFFFALLALASKSKGRKKAIASDFKLFDIIVIGGGPIGLAATYQAAKQGKRVLLLERFSIPNDRGSSSDYTRMFRTVRDLVFDIALMPQMYSDEDLAKMALLAKDRWHALEREAGVQLIEMSGLLNFGDPNYTDGPEVFADRFPLQTHKKQGNLRAPIAIMEKLKVPYRNLTAKQIMAEYPFKNLPDHFVGIFSPANGVINVKETSDALLRLATKYRAQIKTNVIVSDVKNGADGVTVQLESGEIYRCANRSFNAGSLRNQGIQVDRDDGAVRQ
jgi:sarcosine oxidase/L-pipecolate oxidase